VGPRHEDEEDDGDDGGEKPDRGVEPADDEIEPADGGERPDGDRVTSGSLNREVIDRAVG